MRTFARLAVVFFFGGALASVGFGCGGGDGSGGDLPGLDNDAGDASLDDTSGGGDGGLTLGDTFDAGKGDTVSGCTKKTCAGPGTDWPPGPAECGGALPRGQAD